jgi:hypothetical protein
MRKEKIIITCDACKREVKEEEIACFDHYSSTNVVLIEIKLTVNHIGRFSLKDFCKKCTEKIISFFQENNFIEE